MVEYNPPADWESISSSAVRAYSLYGSRCPCHEYQNVSNTIQFDHSHLLTVLGDYNDLHSVSDRLVRFCAASQFNGSVINTNKHNIVC